MSINPKLSVVSKIGIIILTSFLFFILLMCFMVFMTLNNIPPNIFSSNTLQSNTYRYSEINPLKNETHYGVVQINEELSSDEYKSYRNEATGNFIILSHFGGDEYECTGTCSCSENQRRSTAVLTRGMYLLISAFTATVAINMAKEAFEDQCSRMFSKDCDRESIVASIPDCIKKKLDEKMMRRREIRAYSCEGVCLENTRIKTKEAKVVQKKVECRNMKVNGRIRFFVDPETEDFHNFNVRARFKFQKTQLHSFCRNNSKRTYWNIRKDTKKRYRKSSTFCVASNRSGGSDHIKCVLKSVS